jgi:hypothetical protein
MFRLELPAAILPMRSRRRPSAFLAWLQQTVLCTTLALAFEGSILTPLRKNILRSQTTHIKVCRQSGLSNEQDLPLSVEHVPSFERMMRGVMIACGVPKEEIERMLKERRDDREGGTVN